MFIDFFYYLRERGVKVSIGEWMILLEGMRKGLHESTLEGFYRLCRAVILKDESEYDLFDLAFADYFRNLPQAEQLPKEWEEVLEKTDPELVQALTRRDQTESFEAMPGAPGKGKNAPGPGSGSGGGRTAIIAPGSRRFRDFRKDNKFDIDATIDETCRKNGLLHIKYRKPRRNTIRVLLLIDSGGSMSIFARLCSELFQAASASRHLKELRTYYFHNIVYSLLYKEPTLEMKDGNYISVDHLMEECDEKYRVIFVGDAEMHPYELDGTEYNFYDHKNGLPGSETLRLMKRHFPHMIWLNPLPMPDDYAPEDDTHRAIANIVDMFDLTLDGLEKGFRFLLSGKI